MFPFFGNELLAALAEKGIVREFEPDDEILQEGQLIHSFPLVLSGAMRVVRSNAAGNELLLYYLNSGEICSLSLTCCVGMQRSSVRGVAEQKCTILRVPVEYIDRWMQQYPEWKLFVMSSYRNRFDELLETIDALAFSQMDERLVKFFIDRFLATGQRIYTGKHQDVALQLNSSREVISRLLKKMEQRGLVTVSRNQIDYSLLLKDKSAI